MKKNTLTIIIVIGVIVILAIWMMNSYNSMVALQETVTTKWANVESQYQRRSDLIPNLVATVKGYAAHESATLEGVVAARAKATSITIDPSNCTPEQLAEYQKAQGELGMALGRLMAISENYPDLKANTNFLELQEQLEGTENRIQVSRREYNETVQVYNTKIRQFPGNIVAGMFGFNQMNKFEADEEAKNAPKVEF
ncbi:MAG: LemA family protein [Paludibacteraceae bacterium]|nr:LemA family protein [Paludibacteraceae bacterium]